MRLSGDTQDRERDDLTTWLADAYPSAYRTAFLILHDRHDAEEAVQEAFLRAWRFRDAVPAGDGIRPWMYRVVVNSCLSRLRSERSARQRTESLGIRTDTSRSDRPGPETEAEVSETQREVLRAVAALPEHLRVVIVLRFYAGLSEKEIGSVIRRRPGTVKSRVHEAKVLLGRSPGLAHYRSDIAGLADGSAQ